jgi:hypothetical protein
MALLPTPIPCCIGIPANLNLNLNLNLDNPPQLLVGLEYALRYYQNGSLQKERKRTLIPEN